MSEAELRDLQSEVERLRGILPSRIDVDSESLGRDLARLVLALVEFLRQLLERQAIRRMEGGTLTDEEIERVGVALMRLSEKVEEIAAEFGLERSELDLGLRPLGRPA